MLRTYQPNTRKAKKDHGFFARKEAGTGVLNKRCSAVVMMITDKQFGRI